MEEDELPKGANGSFPIPQDMAIALGKHLVSKVPGLLCHIGPAQSGSTHQHRIQAVVVTASIVTGIFVGLGRALVC